MRRGPVSGRPLVLGLSYKPPLAWTEMLMFLGGRGAAGVEVVREQCYLRTVAIGERRGWIAVTALQHAQQLQVTLAPALRPVLAILERRLRALFDLDADPAAVTAALSDDIELAPLLAAAPGLRVPGAFDGFELALRAILGQQVSVRAATTLSGRFAAGFGEPIRTPYPGLTHLSPAPAAIAAASLQTLIDLGLTQRRARTIHELARASADGSLILCPGDDAAAMLGRFRAMAGIGDWTASYVAMRALRMRDAFPHGDLALCKALGGVKPRQALARSESWRPWRAYAAMQLWHGLSRGGG